LEAHKNPGLDLELKKKFTELFARYFAGSELPLTFHYAAAPPAGMGN